MFTLAFFIGIYSYGIYALGLLGLLYWQLVLSCTLAFVGILLYRNRKIVLEKSQQIYKELFSIHDNVFLFLLLLIGIQSAVNLVGALGPELGFDALWYHLTLPKLYLDNHTIFHIPGGLFYYSDMPKLLEMIYTGVLSFHIAFLPKIIHFLFGVLVEITLYKVARRWLSPIMSLLTVLVFSSNLVFGWESISAYVDLGRTFFELLAMWAFLLWEEKKESKWFYYSAIMVGFSITSKVIAFSSLFIFLLLTYAVGKRKSYPLQLTIKWIFSYALVAILIPLPWFIFSFVHTGNPLYPLFSSMLGNAGSAGWQLLSPIYMISTFWTLFSHSADPLSPWYLMLLPLVILAYKKTESSFKILYLYAILALFFWYITPNTGGGRFILPYLPILSLISVYSLIMVKGRQKQLLIVLAILLAFFSIVYRTAANLKFLPVIFNQETTATFLTNHLNFSYGDFYDTDNYFRTHIKPTDMVLLYGFHNLYYVDFPFIDSSYVTKGETFNYIAVQNGGIPIRFKEWKLMYVNTKTHVALYSAGGIPWTY